VIYNAGLETLSAERLRGHQLARLNELLQEILPSNRFYARKLGTSVTPIDWDTFHRWPFTTKAELVADQERNPPLGTIATYPREQYVAYHQTSGTTGRPLVVLDTAESWAWWSECWQYVYSAAGVTAEDRIFFAFSFGPFIGFWAAHAAARRLGALTIPGGGMDSKARLDLISRVGPTVLLATPTYALRLADVARDERIDLTACGLRVAIHAGEPGASLPAVRARIEQAFGARVFDHPGATEVGAFGYMCEGQTAVHINEAEFIAEIVDPASGRAVSDGETGELVLTNLGRRGWPTIRYRTGDLVTAGGRSCACGRTFLTIPGGIIGRADDCIVIRGVNIYPSSIEAIVRQFAIDEFRIVRSLRRGVEQLEVQVEAAVGEAARLADAFRRHLGVRIDATTVPGGTLPRFELKARRLVDLRDVITASHNSPGKSTS
jgi:phenylacetate-CoA ligase